MATVEGQVKSLGPTAIEWEVQATGLSGGFRAKSPHYDMDLTSLSSTDFIGCPPSLGVSLHAQASKNGVITLYIRQKGLPIDAQVIYGSWLASPSTTAHWRWTCVKARRSELSCPSTLLSRSVEALGHMKDHSGPGAVLRFGFELRSVLASLQALPMLPVCYTLGTRLGGGRFGAVYAASNCGTDYKFAAKCGGAAARLLCDAIALRSVRGDGFPLLHGLFQRKGEHVLLMDRLLPFCVWSNRQESQRLGAEAVIKIGGETVWALQRLHKCGFLHRDLKPGNMLVDSSGRVHLADLGLSIPFCSQHVATSHAGSHRRVCHGYGTRRYMPVRAFDEVYTRACDLEALTYVLVFFATGSLPVTKFEGEMCPSVKASDTFQSDGLLGERIPGGTGGRLTEVDADGDTKVQFDGIAGVQAVRRGNFANVKGLAKLARDIQLETRRDPVQLSRHLDVTLADSPKLARALHSMFRYCRSLSPDAEPDYEKVVRILNLSVFGDGLTVEDDSADVQWNAADSMKTRQPGSVQLFLGHAATMICLGLVPSVQGLREVHRLPAHRIAPQGPFRATSAKTTARGCTCRSYFKPCAPWLPSPRCHSLGVIC